MKISQNQIFIIFILTSEGKKFSLEVEYSETIDSVKAKIQDREGIDQSGFFLLFEGQNLEDKKL